MICPRCKKMNPDTAEYCMCGYHYKTGIWDPKFIELAKANSGHKKLLVKYIIYTLLATLLFAGMVIGVFLLFFQWLCGGMFG